MILPMILLLVKKSVAEVLRIYERLFESQRIKKIVYGDSVLENVAILYALNLTCKDTYALTKKSLHDIHLKFGESSVKSITFNTTAEKQLLIESSFGSLGAETTLDFIAKRAWFSECNTTSKPSVFQIGKRIKNALNPEGRGYSQLSNQLKKENPTLWEKRYEMTRFILKKLNGQSFAIEKIGNHSIEENTVYKEFMLFDQSDNQWLAEFGFTLTPDPLNEFFMVLEELKPQQNENLVQEEEPIMWPALCNNRLAYNNHCLIQYRLKKLQVVEYRF
ncbi:hypothetical protein IPH67_03185 [bacterium]|nr:MAG: hypothetical protein IPH67_03185 [bacterium]